MRKLIAKAYLKKYGKKRLGEELLRAFINGELGKKEIDGLVELLGLKDSSGLLSNLKEIAVTYDKRLTFGKRETGALIYGRVGDDYIVVKIEASGRLDFSYCPPLYRPINVSVKICDEEEFKSMKKLMKLRGPRRPLRT